jgi:hypothetical protein
LGINHDRLTNDILHAHGLDDLLQSPGSALVDRQCADYERGADAASGSLGWWLDIPWGIWILAWIATWLGRIFTDRPHFARRRINRLWITRSRWRHCFILTGG